MSYYRQVHNPGKRKHRLNLFLLVFRETNISRSVIHWDFIIIFMIRITVCFGKYIIILIWFSLTGWCIIRSHQLTKMIGCLQLNTHNFEWKSRNIIIPIFVEDFQRFFEHYVDDWYWLVHHHHFDPTNYSVLQYAWKKKENDYLRLAFLMNCLLVFQQYYFVDDLVVVIELVLQLVEQDDYVISDFLGFHMDHVHRYTRLKRKSLHLEIIKITSRVVRVVGKCNLRG